MTRPLILAVDSNIHNLELIRQVFRPQYTVLTSSDGADAITVANTPSLVILSWQLRGHLTGRDTCLALQERWKGVPILVMSEDEKPADFVGSDFITLPWEMGEMMKRVEALIK